MATCEIYSKIRLERLKPFMNGLKKFERFQPYQQLNICYRTRVQTFFIIFLISFLWQKVVYVYFPILTLNIYTLHNLV